MILHDSWIGKQRRLLNDVLVESWSVESTAGEIHVECVSNLSSLTENVVCLVCIQRAVRQNIAQSICR